MTDAKTESSQIRLPAEIFDYIRAEAVRTGMSQNAVMIALMLDGKRFREAKIVIHIQK